jgi:hypothetical protein
VAPKRQEFWKSKEEEMPSVNFKDMLEEIYHSGSSIILKTKLAMQVQKIPICQKQLRKMTRRVMLFVV